MHSADGKVNLLDLGETGLRNYFGELGEKPFRARQIMQWLHQRDVFDFDQMTDLSKALRSRLQEQAYAALPEVQSESRSADGTVKWLFASGSGQAVETVFIPERDRGTLCISSQVGCALDCAFCATGAQGLSLIHI